MTSVADVAYFVDNFNWGKKWFDPVTGIDHSEVRVVQNVSDVTFYFILMLLRVLGDDIEFVYSFLTSYVIPEMRLLLTVSDFRNRITNWKCRTKKRGKKYKDNDGIFFVDKDFGGGSAVGDDLLGLDIRTIGDPEPSAPLKRKKMYVSREQLMNQIEGLQADVQAKQAEITSLKKINAGKSSAYSSLKNKSAEEQPGVMKTDMLSKLGNGFVQIVERVDCLGVNAFNGIEFSGESCDQRNNTTGRLGHYLCIGSKARPNSCISKSEIDRRASFAVVILSFLSGCSWEDIRRDDGSCDVELSCLLSKMLHKKKELGFGKLDLSNKLSVSQAVDLRSLLRMSMSAFRRMRSILCNFGFSIMPSESPMRIEQARRIKHVTDAKMVSETMLLRPLGLDQSESIEAVVVYRSSDLQGYVESVFSKATNAFRFNGDTIWIAIGGDKGGGLSKLHFQICRQSSSVFDVHLFAMYAASDCSANLQKVSRGYGKIIKYMENGSYILPGTQLKVKFFVVGDCLFQDAAAGLQGSSATHPCLHCLVSRAHLKDHQGKPHTPDDCKLMCPPRNLEDMEGYLSAGVVDERGGAFIDGSIEESRRVSGRHHGSVVGRMIFPVSSLNVFVPPVLHITLGIILRLFNLLLEKCRFLDGRDSTFVKQAQSDWRTLSKALEIKEDECRDLGASFLDLMNLDARLKAYAKGNLAEVDEIAKASEYCVHRKQILQDKCESSFCCISDYDININWILCSICDKWYHILCEGIMTHELKKKVKGKYTCLSCKHDKFDLPSMLKLIEEAKSSLRDYQDEVEYTVLDLSARCRFFKQQSEIKVGPFEKKLLAVLDDIGVVRQAYHGNTFIGNHCKIIMKFYSQLLAVIATAAPDDHKHFLELFKLFSEAHSFMTLKRMLTPVEVEELVGLCHEFGKKYPVFFPTSTITRKIHDFVFHVPEFVREFKTIGFLTEEEGEGIHKSINEEGRRNACVRDPALKMELMHKGHELVGVADREVLITKKRKCSECKAFLIKGMCPTCPC